MPPDRRRRGPCKRSAGSASPSSRNPRPESAVPDRRGRRGRRPARCSTPAPDRCRGSAAANRRGLSISHRRRPWLGREKGSGVVSSPLPVWKRLPTLCRCSFPGGSAVTADGSRRCAAGGWAQPRPGPGRGNPGFSARRGRRWRKNATV